MPEGDKKLTAAQKEAIRVWIEAGARTARPEPENVEDARFTLEELQHWAFQPVQPQQPPDTPGMLVANPIDAFVAVELAKHQLRFSPPADRHTLIRRVTFDLTGLPPHAF